MLKNQEELEAIRFKVMNVQTDLTKVQKDCLKAVYDEIQERYVSAKNKFKIDCSGCIKNGLEVVRNYIQFHEQVQSEKKHAKVRMIVEEPTNDIQNDVTNVEEQLEGLSLAELRAKFPHIKSNSVKGFITKLKNN